MRRYPILTFNPNTGGIFFITGFGFLNLLKLGFLYHQYLNRLYSMLLPLDTPKYVPKLRIISPNNRYRITRGAAYYEILRDNYRPRGSKWVKMSKEEAKEYDNDLNNSTIFALDIEDSSDDSDYPDDIDEFEYNEDKHAILPF